MGRLKQSHNGEPSFRMRAELQNWKSLKERRGFVHLAFTACGAVVIMTEQHVQEHIIICLITYQSFSLHSRKQCSIGLTSIKYNPCISPALSSVVCPVKGQVFSECARACTFTCDNVKTLFCVAVCTTGCDCPGGQVIDTKLNKCVPIEECPAKKECKWNDTISPSASKFVLISTCCIVSCSSNRCGYGICAMMCSDDSECTGRQKCCPTACSGTSCTRPVRRRRPHSTGNMFFGLSYTVCEYNGQVYRPGDSFPASDGCNTWWVCVNIGLSLPVEAFNALSETLYLQLLFWKWICVLHRAGMHIKMYVTATRVAFYNNTWMIMLHKACHITLHPMQHIHLCHIHQTCTCYNSLPT